MRILKGEDRSKLVLFQGRGSGGEVPEERCLNCETKTDKYKSIFLGQNAMEYHSDTLLLSLSKWKVESSQR